MHIKTTLVRISHRNKLPCLLQAGRSHVVICNDLWKEVCMSDISSECPGTHWCNSNFFYSSITIQGRKFDTIYHKFNLVSKFDGINQKAAQLISQLVDSNTSTFMKNSINMFLISVHSAARQAPWIFSILDRCHSTSGLQNNQILLSAPLLPLWKQMLTSERFLHQFCQSQTTWCICIVL